MTLALGKNVRECASGAGALALADAGLWTLLSADLGAGDFALSAMAKKEAAPLLKEAASQTVFRAMTSHGLSA
jgi:hypothetical protein